MQKSSDLLTSFSAPARTRALIDLATADWLRRDGSLRRLVSRRVVGTESFRQESNDDHDGPTSDRVCSAVLPGCVEWAVGDGGVRDATKRKPGHAASEPIVCTTEISDLHGAEGCSGL